MKKQICGKIPNREVGMNIFLKKFARKKIYLFLHALDKAGF